MPKKPKKVATSRLRAVEVAREARLVKWAVKPGRDSVQARLQIPSTLRQRWDEQDTTDRGSTWSDGFYINQELGLLYAAVAKLNRSELPSFIVDKDGVTVILGQKSVTAPTQIEALIKLLREVVYGSDNGTDKN